MNSAEWIRTGEFEDGEWKRGDWIIDMQDHSDVDDDLGQSWTPFRHRDGTQLAMAWALDDAKQAVADFEEREAREWQGEVREPPRAEVNLWFVQRLALNLQAWAILIGLGAALIGGGWNVVVLGSAIALGVLILVAAVCFLIRKFRYGQTY